jgi:2-polyprenyl-3-methyl-5-hydroxy-6-metoxy-1,4-benzoquinol methylase
MVAGGTGGVNADPRLRCCLRRRESAVRLVLRGDNPLEWLALRLRLVPEPAAQAWAGVALTGVLVAAQRLGLTARLAAGPATAEALCADLGLDPTAGRLLLDCLCSVGHVTRGPDGYRLARASRRWLDPGSELSVGRFVAANADYFAWWAGLDEVARTGRPVGHHEWPADDGYWRRYVTGQLELARLSAREVARRLRLPAGASRVLDVGGGHGWYAAELCRRHPGLAATVLDLPGSARIGREIIAEAGMSGRVAHVEGDALEADLGTGYDAALCFNLVHHLREEQIVALFGRVRGALRPGGVFAVMDAFAAAARRTPNAVAFLRMFMYLSSGSSAYTPGQLGGWLDAAGFGAPRRVAVRRLPGQGLYVASRRDGD